MKRVIGFVLVVFLAASCTSDVEFIETPDGLKYRLLVDEPGNNLQEGQLMIVTMKQLLNDSLVFESAEIGDVLNPQMNLSNELKLILDECSAGDSVEIEMTMKQYVEMNQSRYPLGVDSLDMLTWRIKVVDLGSQEDIMTAFQSKIEAEAETQLAADMNELKALAVNNNLDYQETDEGVLFVVLKEGNGEYPQIGQKVYVNYSVRMMDSTFVDTSFEDQAKANGVYSAQRPGGYVPISFELGGPGIISGWNIGIPQFSKGGRGYLLVPSRYAYGSNGKDQIGPNENLLFEIEVVEFENE